MKKTYHQTALESVVSRDELLRYLNLQDLSDFTDDFRADHKTMCDCVELVLTFTADMAGIEGRLRSGEDPRSLLQYKIDRARQFKGELWGDRLNKIIESGRIHLLPQSVFGELGEFERSLGKDYSPSLEFEKGYKGFKIHPAKKRLGYDQLKQFSFAEVFHPGGPWVYGDPPRINYALAFVALLSDPDAGIRRLRRCPICGLVFVGRPDQKFCANKCRSTFNNKQRSPDYNRNAVYKYREEVKEQENGFQPGRPKPPKKH